MIQFEERLSESAQRLAARDNKTLHVPANPLAQRRSYWGWVAAPAAAVAGIVLGLSMNYIAQGKPEIRYVANTEHYAGRGKSESRRKACQCGSFGSGEEQRSLRRGGHGRLHICPMRRHQLCCVGTKLKSVLRHGRRRRGRCYP